MSTTTLVDLLKARELKAVSKLCSSGSISEDAIDLPDSEHEITPLMAFVCYNAVESEGLHISCRDDSNKKIGNVARAMIATGADPTKEAPASCTHVCVARTKCEQLDEEGDVVYEDWYDEVGRGICACAPRFAGLASCSRPWCSAT